MSGSTFCLMNDDDDDGANCPKIAGEITEKLQREGEVNRECREKMKGE